MNTLIKINAQRVNVTDNVIRYDIAIVQNGITERSFVKPKEAFSAIRDLYYEADSILIQGNYKKQ